MTELGAAAMEWAAGDPDPETSAELREIVESGDEFQMQRAMGGTLEFGTAGIRGRVGPGSNQMNRAVVIKTTAGLVAFLEEKYGGVPPAPVVVGFDARPTSRAFAEDTVGVLAAAGIEVVFFPEVTPTPIVAFAAKVLQACAAVVVTASHNPPADNGYKVYDSNAAQIIPPTDTAIAAHIDAAGPANQIARIADVFSTPPTHVSPAPAHILDAYRAEVDSYRVVKPGRTVRVVYTPLHGVGGEIVTDAFSRTIHDDVHVVEAQFAPDGAFPTVAFPNPEEKGALDLAMERGTEVGAHLLIANDPDADRLAAAVATPEGWRLFTGNELGVILGSHLLANPPNDARPITANSVVSSPMFELIAAEYEAIHLTTLTGFKWIANAALAVEAEQDAEFLFGYEEALGYSVGRTVRDKDGISAAVLLADIAALQEEAGHTLLGVLEGLWRRYGLWVSTQASLVRPGEDGQRAILEAVDRLASEPPATISGIAVEALTDYRHGAGDRPPWLGAQSLVELDLGARGRVLARPSGTEPKLKIYVDLQETPDDGMTSLGLHEMRARVLAEAEGIAASVAEMVG
jgi:phosphomannomutase